MNSNNQLNKCEICEASTGAIGFHYGVVICEACKKFFLRSEKNNTYLNYKCNQMEKCFVIITSRAHCQYCRYKKCKQLGMDLKFNVKNFQNNSETNEECKICSQKSSGIHFGVETCEGCKSFYLRSIKKDKYKDYKCKSNNICEVNVCKLCRFEKCTQVGMSLNGCKIGRKSNITKLNNQKRNASTSNDIIEIPKAKRTRRIENIKTISNDFTAAEKNNSINNNTINETSYYESNYLPAESFSFQPFIIEPTINISYESNQLYCANTNYFQQNSVPIYQQNIQMLTPVYMVTSNYDYPIFNQELLVNSSLTNLVARFNE